MKKLTNKQKQIMEALEGHRGALSAADIHEQVKDDMDLATVYRALDKLTEERLLKKLVLNGRKALYEYARDAHHHAVCADCDEVIHFHIDDTQLKKLVDVPGFDIQDIEIVVRGSHCH